MIKRFSSFYFLHREGTDVEIINSGSSQLWKNGIVCEEEKWWDGPNVELQLRLWEQMGIHNESLSNAPACRPAETLNRTHFSSISRIQTIDALLCSLRAPCSDHIHYSITLSAACSLLSPPLYFLLSLPAALHGVRM